MARKKKLGRGLNALLGSNTTSTPENTAAESAQTDASTSTLVAETPEAQPDPVVEAPLGDKSLTELPIEWIQRGKYQPRRDMHPEALEELAISIRAQGVMQPIVVRPVESSDTEPRYEIIAGERRWRATQQAGLDKIPALIREVADEDAVAMALIENIQREDLNPMEEALALLRLKDEFELTHQDVADAVGKSRSAVTNLLRLTTLNSDVQRMLEHGDLEMGHARALLSLPEAEQKSAASEVAGKGLSVRQTEAMVRRLLQQTEQGESAQSAEPSRIDPDIRNLQNELSEKIGVPVIVQHSAKGKGKLVLKYNNLDELDGILNHIH